MLLLIFLIALAYFLYVGVYKPMQFWKNKGVPYAKSVPLLGSQWKSLFLIEPFPDTLKRIYSSFENERYFGMFLLAQPTLCIRDLDLIKQIAVKDFDHFTDHFSIISPEAEPLIAKNLLNMQGNEWRQMRATLSPVFTSSKMRGMFALMSECGRDLAEYLRGQNQEKLDVELKQLFTKCTNDVIATTSFGIKCNSLHDDENDFYQMGKKVTSIGVGSFIKIFLYVIIPKIMQALKVSVLPKKVTSFFHTIVTETKRAREDRNIHRPDMLQLLFEAQKGRLKADDDVNEETEKHKKHQLSDEDITAQALVFFFAGFDTVSTALSFMLLELAIHPEVQAKLQEEIDEVLAKHEITYERVVKMTYLDQVISETLRKWPPVSPTHRICTKQYTIQPVREGERPLVLEKGTAILIPINAVHYDSRYFPDPERFDPERFSEENKGCFVSGSYMPFGVGPRNCIGSRFALLEIKILVVHLLSKFNVVPTEKTQIPIKISPKNMTPTPVGNFWVAFKQRKVINL